MPPGPFEKKTRWMLILEIFIYVFIAACLLFIFLI